MTQATAGDLFAALYAGHQIGDHWVQTSAQAAAKSRPGRDGRRACAAHVATLTLTKAVTVAVLHLSGRRVRPVRAGVALAADAASHYWADRRSLDPVRGLPRLARATGSLGFWTLGLPRAGRDDNLCLGTGGYALDQAFHAGCLWAAALLAARKLTSRSHKALSPRRGYPRSVTGVLRDPGRRGECRTHDGHREDQGVAGPGVVGEPGAAVADAAAAVPAGDGAPPAVGLPRAPTGGNPAEITRAGSCMVAGVETPHQEDAWMTA